MSAVEVWVTIVLMTAVTVATRTVMLVFGDRIPLPERTAELLWSLRIAQTELAVADEALQRARDIEQDVDQRHGAGELALDAGSRGARLAALVVGQ